MYRFLCALVTKKNEKEATRHMKRNDIFALK